MAAVSVETIKELRQRTGAGVTECKKALTESDGDVEKALDVLRKRGVEIAAKKAHRVASEGVVFAYIHPPGKVGTIIELNCESDFVARNEKFQTLAKDLAMHITAMAPHYISREEVPAAEMEKQRSIFAEQAKTEGKTEDTVENIIAAKMDRFFAEQCLLEQPFVKNPDRTVKELIQELIAVIGENIVLRRFVRFGVGETEEE